MPAHSLHLRPQAINSLLCPTPERITALDAQSPVVSPCISICVIDEDSGLCKGCWRTRDEIAGWSAASDPERLAILDRLKARQIEAGVRRPRKRRERGGSQPGEGVGR